MSNEFKFANLVQRANFNKWLAQYTHREEALIAAFVEMEKLRANNEKMVKMLRDFATELGQTESKRVNDIVDSLEKETKPLGDSNET